MNKSVLLSYNKSIDNCIDEYSEHFQQVQSINTDNEDQNKVSLKVTTDVLQALDALVSEKVAYFEKDDFVVADEISWKISTENIDSTELKFAHRAEVEANNQWLQPIPVGVIVSLDKKKVLAGKKVSRATSEKSAEKGKILFYFGGHVRREDKYHGASNLEVIQTALQREIKEELGIDYAPNFEDALCIFDRSKDPNPQHFAIATLCFVDFETMKVRVDTKEFGERSIKMLSQDDVINGKLKTERWSQVIIQRLLQWSLI